MNFVLCFKNSFALFGLSLAHRLIDNAGSFLVGRAEKTFGGLFPVDTAENKADNSKCDRANDCNDHSNNPISQSSSTSFFLE